MLRHVLLAVRQQNASPLAWAACAVTRVIAPGSKLQLLLPAASSITTKVPRSPEDGSNAKQLPTPQHAVLRAVLQDKGLSFSAMMAVLRDNDRHRFNPDTVQQRIQQLQDFFGPSMTSDMLTLAPYLLMRCPERLIQYFEGLVGVLGAGRVFALDLVKRSPDILQHKPELVQSKMASLKELFQVDHASLLRLVRKAPTLLKCQPAKLQPHLKFLASVGGLDPPHVFKVYLSWPVMATTTTGLVKQRYKELQQLLQASPEEMGRICRVFPNLLGRDPAQLATNISTLAEQLGIPKDQMVTIVRKEPGLLSWNVSTLVNRIMSVSQMLKLPRDLSLTLLLYNRPLLTNVSALPQKLEVLQRVLSVSEEELYPLVHKYMTLLRFPVESVDAKLSCVSSLALLHPAWSQDWAQHSMLGRVRAIQAGWACHWRLVYLINTGQQGSMNLGTALRLNHARFRDMYPGYQEWLDRYNHAVTAADIPLAAGHARPIEQALTGPSTYMPVLPDASMGKALHSGSLYIRHKHKALEQQSHYRGSDSSSNSSSAVGLSTSLSGGSGSAVDSLSSSLGGSSSSSSSSSSSDSRARRRRKGTSPTAAAVAAVAALPATPAGRLAAWFSIELSVAQQLLEDPHMKKMTVSGLQARLAAAETLLSELGYCPNPAASAAGASVSNSSSSASQASGAATTAAAAADADAASSSAVWSCPMVLASGQAQPQSVQQLQMQQLHKPQQYQQQTVDLIPPPLAQQALQHALSTGHAAGVAGVSVACLLAPFAQQLYHTPPRPPDAVVQLVVQHTTAFVRKTFVGNCSRLAALARGSPYLQQQLQDLELPQLAEFMACIQPRLRYVQYLVQTQQPAPWAFSLRMLLLGTKWYSFKETHGTREKFCVAYPGYAQWEEEMQSL